MIHTKEFWVKVWEDYSLGLSTAICTNSDTFKDAWAFNREEVRALAMEYLIVTKNETFRLSNEGGYLSLLFVASVLMDSDKYIFEVRKVREKFILYCIDKYKDQ